MAHVEFNEVYKHFGVSCVVDSLCLDILSGELMVLLGPSGCGKTTSLRMLAGFESPSSGEIRINDRVVNGMPAKDRDVAMVFQNYALFPHMSVFKNLAFGMKARHEPKEEIKQRIQDVAAQLGITDLLERRPAQLSGGQRQRVALGRALLRRPQVFLMDEPLSNLDAALRAQMRLEICQLQERMRITTLYVTHDQVEAMTMGDRIAVMLGGQLQQLAQPEMLYGQPCNVFVAAFIGAPRMNLAPGTISSGDDGSMTVGFLGTSFRVNDDAQAVLRSSSERDVIVGLRAEDLSLSGQPLFTADGLKSQLPGIVETVEPLGPETLVVADVDGTPLIARVPPRSQLHRQEPVNLEFDSRHVHLFYAATGRNILCPTAPAFDVTTAGLGLAALNNHE